MRVSGFSYRIQDRVTVACNIMTRSVVSCPEMWKPISCILERWDIFYSWQSCWLNQEQKFEAHTEFDVTCLRRKYQINANRTDLVEEKDPECGVLIEIDEGWVRVARQHYEGGWMQRYHLSEGGGRREMPVCTGGDERKRREVASTSFSTNHRWRNGRIVRGGLTFYRGECRVGRIDWFRNVEVWRFEIEK